MSWKHRYQGCVIMKLLSLILLLISLSANSSGLSAPQAAAETFFQYFNARDIESLNNASGRPFIFVAGGNLNRAAFPLFAMNGLTTHYFWEKHYRSGTERRKFQEFFMILAWMARYFCLMIQAIHTISLQVMCNFWTINPCSWR